MIQTKQSKAVQAYKAIDKMAKGALPLPVSYSFFKLKKALQCHIEFQISKEQELFDQYQPVFNEDGIWTFKSEDDKNEFVKKINEIGELDVEIDSNIITISQTSGITMSIEDMEALDAFVEFE